jgi:WD40 repeat protein
MDFTQKINYAHFQLRNLVACTSRNNVFYAGDACVYQYHPLFGKKSIRMDLSDPLIQPAHSTAFSGVIVSTLAAEHNVLVAGGYFGEYAMSSLETVFEIPHTEGLVTDNSNAITNHVQITLNRHSGLPQAVFCSNDSGLRILDCTTNRFVSQQEFAYPVNCSAVSPDSRLRAIVGDSRSVLITNAETGEVLQELDGHEDYGFACAWSDNGWNVATGNQDRMVKIWDARMWKDHNGHAKPLKSIASSMAGVRSLRYSPVGSGKRVLIAAEQGDNFSIIDAETYCTKQEFDFFGEILGIALTPDGQDLFVGIHDQLRGGMMEFEKCGFGELYEQPRTYRHNDTYEQDPYDEEISAGHDWKRTIEEVVAHSKSKRTATHRRRRAANLGDMDPF